MLTEEQKKYLRERYFDPRYPASLSGATKFYNALKRDPTINVSKADVRNWLKSQDSFTAHAALRRNFKRPRVIAPYKNYQWEIDTAHLTNLVKYNEGYKYFLMVTDVLSHYMWTAPLKTLTGKEVGQALRDIFTEVKPEIIRSDKGSEFKNNIVEKLFKDNGIKHIFTTGEVKANFSERAIKTLKLKLQRYFSQNQTHKWYTVLKDIRNSYNNTVHRSVGITPLEALNTEDSTLWERQYGIKPKKVKKEKNTKRLKRYFNYRFPIDARVKLPRIKHPFQREYDQRWTDEVFTITYRYINQGNAMYNVKDYSGDPIDGGFYQQELQKVDLNDDTVYRIEKILKKRKRKGKVEVLVKWVGWPNKFNSYIPEADLVEYNNEK